MSDSPRAPFLAELTWPQVAELLEAARRFAILPVGSTEAHGPHLPLSADAVIATEAARRAAVALNAEGLPTVVAPTIPYVVTDCGSPFPGTVTLHAETATRLLADVMGGLARQGFDRIVVANAHLEPAHIGTIEAAIAQVTSSTGAAIAFPDKRLSPWKERLSEEFRRGARHGGAYETSLLLAAAPGLVRTEALPGLAPVWIDLPAAIRAGARTFKEAGSPQGYFGDPAASSAAHGEELYRALAGMLVEAARSLR